MALGFTSPYYVPVAGSRLYLVEILLLLVVLFSLMQPVDRERWKLAAPFVPLGGLWLAGQLISDSYREVSLTTSLVVSANIVLFVFDLVGLILVMTTGTIVRSVAIGAALGGLAATVLQPNPNFHLAAWKFGYGLPIAILVLVLLTGRKQLPQLGAFLILLCIAVVNLLFDYRSLALILALGAVTVLRHRSRPRRRRGKVLRRRLLPLLAMSIVALFGFNSIYSSLASSGALGEQASVRFTSQSVGAYGVVLGARKEVIAMAVSIADSPWVGAGSGAALTREHYGRTLEILQNANYPLLAPDFAYLSQRPLPAHSAFVGSWFLAGIAAVPFWLYFVVRLSGQLRNGLSGSHSYVAMVIGVWLLTATFFSPLGAEQRFILALAAAALITLAQSAEPSDAERRRE